MIWHPFKVGMSADQVLKIERRKEYRRIAKNQVRGRKGAGRMIIDWCLEVCTLRIGWTEFEEYGVLEILPPVEDARYMTRAQAGLTPEEVDSQLAILGLTRGSHTVVIERKR